MPRDTHSHAHRVAAYPAHAPKRHHAEPERHRRGSAGLLAGSGSNGTNGIADLGHEHDGEPEEHEPQEAEASTSRSVKKPQRSATQLAGEDLYIRLNDRDDFWAEIEALLELPEGCDLVMLDNTIRMFVTICGAYHGESLVELPSGCRAGRATTDAPLARAQL